MNSIEELNQILDNIREHIATVPGDVDALADLAAVLAQLGQTEEALTMLLSALQQCPDHLGLQHNQAELYRNTGMIDQAESLFTKLVTKYPHFVPAYQSLILILVGRLETGQLTTGQFAEVSRQIAIYSSNKGNALLDIGQIESAEAAYVDALKYWPDYPAAHSNLSNVSRMMGQVSKAEMSARTALALRPDFAGAWNNLGTALSEQGRCAEAMGCYQRALTLDPGQDGARHNAGSGSLFLQLYRDDLTVDQVVKVHREWGKSYPFAALPEAVALTGKLRVGFISGDFREHSVMYFVEALLEKLDRTKFEIVCYANQTGEDAVTRRIKALPLKLRQVAALSDTDLCDQIREDQLHILIDLSGHTKGHRVYALANKPVRVMAHWLGYPFTSGLPAFDYRISDRWADPEASAAEQHTEQLAYLTGSQFNYRPKADAPEVNALPAASNGLITFGSLNNIQKLNRSVVSVWSQILLNIPDSRLILQNKLLADAGVAGRIRGMFEAFGVDAARLDCSPASLNHLARYHEIDIALDTFPYNGATTTCEALWMGVPVLALAGDGSVGRMGASILSAIGMESWLANSVGDYIRLAQRHSALPDNLALLRKGLRHRMAGSRLCDEEEFAVDFGRCLREMVGFRRVDR